MDNMEVITTADKAQRDKMYNEYRKSADPLERQVVKFSGAMASGSAWSIAYPRTTDETPTGRRKRKEAQRVRESQEITQPDSETVVLDNLSGQPI